MVTITIYVEGGGDGNDLKERCRKGFQKFFEKAGLKGRMPKVVACGARQNAYDRFCTAVTTAGGHRLPLLLVDSEDMVSESPWRHLKSRDGWNCPDGAQEEQAHLMVQVMESWFLADRPALVRHFGQGFRESALPHQTRLEEIPKQTVFDSLKSATRDSRAGAYAKGKHSFEILGKIDPSKVRSVSPHADRLLRAIDNLNE